MRPAQRNGRVRCSAQLGIISVSFPSFPSSPGIVKPHRRAGRRNVTARTDEVDSANKTMARTV